MIKRSRLLFAVVFLLLAMVGAGCVSKDVRRFISFYASGSSGALKEIDLDALAPADQGAYLFLQGDFGALSTDTLNESATPWALTATLITLNYVDGDAAKLTADNMAAAFRQFGIASPAEVSNWPSHLPQPDLQNPVGLVTGKVARRLPEITVTAANFSCAMCHSSVAFDKHGMPDPERVWVGVPNGSVNLEAYPQAIFDGFVRFGKDPDLLDSVQMLFRDLSETERDTLKKYVLPRAVKRIDELEATTGRAVPFKGGYPGLTNGLDALQIRLGLKDRNAPVELSAFNSIPTLEDRALRTSLLNVANYEIPGASIDRTMKPADVTDAHLDQLGAIVAHFAIPSMGLDLATAVEQIPNAQTVMRFVSEFESPRFPGEIDQERAQAGRAVYSQHCASCHGVYSESNGHPNLASYPNHISDVGTDPLLISLLTDEFAAAVNQSSMGKYIHVASSRGYSAPSLSGIWLSAPYLHNGSVPTLWGLMNPDERPITFPIGGHMLDYDKVGVKLDVDESMIARYPVNYEPWSVPVVFDTRKKGTSNAGHRAPFDVLTNKEKHALLEYMKTL